MSELVKKHILLIYSSHKVPRSLKFCTTRRILVLNMHRKFDVDTRESFWDMEEQSMWRKERKKERTRKLHLQANVSKKVIIMHNPSYKLEAFRECRHSWLRQIITPIFPNVIMLSLGSEKLTQRFKSLPAPRSVYATTIIVIFCSFTHLRISRSPPKFNQFFIILPWTPP